MRRAGHVHAVGGGGAGEAGAEHLLDRLDHRRRERRRVQQRRRDGEPLAALLFACLGRGRGLYGQPDGDVGLCRESFPQLPIAGVFCNGEIGPVGGSTHLHGYTASWGFLVPED
jgi:small ligand-binding sensory domain FIST